MLQLALASMKSPRDLAVAAVFAAVFAFLILVGTGIKAWRTGESPFAYGGRWFLLNVLAMTGVVCIILFVLGLALLVFFFVACLARL